MRPRPLQTIDELFPPVRVTIAVVRLRVRHPWGTWTRLLESEAWVRENSGPWGTGADRLGRMGTEEGDLPCNYYSHSTATCLEEVRPARAANEETHRHTFTHAYDITHFNQQHIQVANANAQGSHIQFQQCLQKVSVSINFTKLLQHFCNLGNITQGKFK